MLHLEILNKTEIQMNLNALYIGSFCETVVKMMNTEYI